MTIVEAPLTQAGREWREHIERGELMVRRCGRCGTYRLTAAAVCPRCGSREAAWVPASGRGIIHSATVVHRNAEVEFRGAVPYVVAVVALTEGPWLVTNVVGCPPEAATIGAAVEVTWDGAPFALPVFRLAPTDSGEEAP